MPYYIHDISAGINTHYKWKKIKFSYHNFIGIHSVCFELHTYNLLHAIRQPVMSNQEQPCSTGASGPAIQQQPLLYPTPQQNVVTSAPRVFCHSAPGVQPQVLPYHEQPTTTFTQPYVVCLCVWDKYLLCNWWTGPTLALASFAGSPLTPIKNKICQGKGRAWGRGYPGPPLVMPLVLYSKEEIISTHLWLTSSLKQLQEGEGSCLSPV